MTLFLNKNKIIKSTFNINSIVLKILQAWGGGGPNHQGGQGYPGSQQWGGFNR